MMYVREICLQHNAEIRHLVRCWQMLLIIDNYTRQVSSH